MNKSFQTLEFNKIIDMLCEHSLSEKTVTKFLNLKPYLKEKECIQKINEVTEARKIIDSLGNPPLTSMKGLIDIILLCEKDGLLSIENLLSVMQFAVSSKRIKKYLHKADFLYTNISNYGLGINDLTFLEEEISRCIRGFEVDNYATKELSQIRSEIENSVSKIQTKLNTIIQKNKKYLADDYSTIRNGRYVIPVKKEYKNQISGIVVDTSRTGNAVFIEPTAINKLIDEIEFLKIEEINEVTKILYILTGHVIDSVSQIKSNMEILEDLDFIFAKAKLSSDMDANPATINSNRQIKIISGRHPLLKKEDCVPLDFEFGKNISGVVITGPNTGGKTVSLKTIGLLSMMAQSGLHVPAKTGTTLCMNSSYFCDIGDGQSISENLSTFSSHIKNIIEILKNCNSESLVLLDELGSGTDPAEGMGIATAIIAKLVSTGCLFVATTHYPEIKDFANSSEKLMNARMLFDPETFKPLYKMEIGKAGESCALQIAKRLGFPSELLEIAHDKAYNKNINFDFSLEQSENKSVIEKNKPTKQISTASQKFSLGDSVMVYPTKENGIVFKSADEIGQIGVQLKGKKIFVNHKRLKIIVKAEEMYPEDYDFSIIFDSVENRKARKKMDKGHLGNIAKYED